MKERLLALALAAAALALFYALFFPKPQHRPAALGLPLSTDSAPEGYRAIWRWLAEQHIPRLSLRYHYGRLFGLLPRRSGNVLILTLPQREPMTYDESGDLENWVGAGNTLLIVAAIDDEPQWAAATGDSRMAKVLRRFTGLEFTPGPASSFTHSLASARLHFRRRGALPLLAGVGRITAILRLPSRSWRARVTGKVVPLAIAARSDDGAPAVWLEQRGRGQVILCAAASPLSNAGIALGGNARFLANIIAWSRERGGAVVFDDAHEGLTEYYDARKFFADPRLHWTIFWVLVLWLAFVLGSQPLAVGRAQWRPLDESAYIEVGARYLAAVVEPSDAARHLIEEFVRAIERRLARGASAWEWLETAGRIAPTDRRALQRLYARACAGERLDLIGLQNLLARLRRTLT